ncbi:MAG: phosphoglycerate mutase family protein, partial [Ignavibacteriota bacterium]
MKNLKLNIRFLIIFILLTTFYTAEIYSQNNDDNKKGTRTIYLVRHGYYDEADTRDEDVGKELTPLGIAQARLVASRLKGMPIEFSSLTSSTMTRARQTAMIINESFPELTLNQSP